MHISSNIRNIISIVIALLIILTSGYYFFITHAAGNTYYISPTGSDTTGDGSQENPWKSLRKVFASVPIDPGDKIYLRGGTYLPTSKNDFYIMEASGNSLQYIDIEAYPGEIPIIDARNITDFSQVSDAVLKFAYCSYINLKGLTLVGGNSVTGVQSRGLQINSSNAYINISDFTITDTYLKGVGLSGQHLIFENSEVYNTSRDNVDGILADETGWEQAISTYTGANDIAIRNNYIHENWGEGIDVILGQNVVIEKNILHDNFGTNIYIDTSKDIQIRKNYVYYENSDFNRNGLPSNSIKMANENNEPSLFIDNIVISNNILAIGNKRGISYFQQNGTYSNVKIYNNVIYNPLQNAIWFEDTSSTSGNEIINNIIYDGSDFEYTIIDIDLSDISGWSFSNNSWQNELPPFWASNVEDNNSEPVFSNPITVPSIINKPYYPLSEALEFRLSEFSPLLNAGISLDIIADDYEGNSREFYSDIGPFEFIYNSPTPTPSTPHYIFNIASNLNVVEQDSSINLEPEGPGTTNNSENTRITNTSNYILADVIVNLSTDRNWPMLTGDVDPFDGKAFVHGITSAPGAASSFILYIPKLAEHNTVRICPGASSLSQITIDCSGGYDLTQVDSNVTIVNILGQNYWKISGLTGTGGIGFNSGIANTRVELSNENYSATDDIEFWFDTPTDLTANSKLYINYDSNFTGGSSITSGDVTVYCDADGLAGGGIPLSNTTLTSSSNGRLEFNFNSDTCSDWIRIDIHGNSGHHLTNPPTSGNYSWSIVTDVSGDGTDDDSGATLAYVDNDNDVNITAFVHPVIDLELFQTSTDIELSDANSCDLGVLSLNNVNICTYDLGTGTNNPAGISVYVQSDGALRDNLGNDINSTIGNVDSGTEEYGFYIRDNGGGEYSITGSYSSAYQIVPTTLTLIATTNSTGSGTTAGSSTQHLEINHAASMSTDTIVGNYGQIVTFEAFTN